VNAKAEEKLKARIAKATAKEQEAGRLRKAGEAALRAIENTADDRRKYLDGVAAQYRCFQSPEFAREHAIWREKVLVRNDERALFGEPPLTREQQLAREKFLAAFRRASREETGGVAAAVPPVEPGAPELVVHNPSPASAVPPGEVEQQRVTEPA
jgi:hypothetical protein